MRTINRQFQPLHMAKKNPHTAEFNLNQYVRNQALGAKMRARLYCSKDGSDLEMIEKFYSRLLPVTFRDWTCSKE